MGITAAPGWQVDPSNPNAVIPINAASVNNPNTAIAQPKSIPTALTATFANPPSQTKPAPVILTSKPAQDKLATMKAQLQQAASDLSAMQAAKNNPPPAPTPSPNSASPANANSSSPTDIDSLLDSLSGNSSESNPTSPTDITSSDEAAIANDQNEQLQITNTLDSINNGSYPLSTAEQAQVSGVKDSYAAAIQAASDYARNVESGAHVAAAASGLEMYSPNLALGNIKTAISAGQQKITNLNAKILDAQNKLTTSLLNNDYKTASALYTSISNDIKTRTAEITNIQKQVSTETTALQKQNTAIQTANQKEITTLLNEVGKNGAPASVMDAISGAGSIGDAIKAAGSYLQTGSGLIGEYQLYARQATAAGQSPVDFNTFANMSANRKVPAVKTTSTKTTTAASPTTNASGNAIGTTGNAAIDTTQQAYNTIPVPSAGGLTQAAIDQAALNYAMTGTMPSVGLGSTGAAGEKRTAIENRAAELNAGGNIASNKATLTSLSKALTTQQGYAITTQRSLDSGQQGLQQLVDAFKSKGINASNITIANAMANAAKYQLSPNDIAAFQAGLQEVANEYAQVFARGGASTNLRLTSAQDILDGNLSLNALQSIGDELQAQGAIVVKNANDAVKYTQDQINGIIGGTSKPSTADELVQTESNAKQSVISAASGKPKLQAAVHKLLSSPNPATGQAWNYQDLEQYLQATGQM